MMGNTFFVTYCTPSLNTAPFLLLMPTSMRFGRAGGGYCAAGEEGKGLTGSEPPIDPPAQTLPE